MSRLSKYIGSQFVKPKGLVGKICGDCCDLTFADEQFDTVVTVNTIYFWEDTVKGLKEIRRVLKSEGTFYSAVYSKQWMSKSETLNEGKKTNMEKQS